jgi:hypothetical protein
LKISRRAGLRVKSVAIINLYADKDAKVVRSVNAREEEAPKGRNEIARGNAPVGS